MSSSPEAPAPLEDVARRALGRLDLPLDEEDVVCTPAHITRTAGEFLGQRALPRLIVERKQIFLLGPPGSGKSLVALRLAGPEPVILDGKAVRAQLVSRARHGRFPVTIEQASVLLLDGVDCLYGREGAVRLLGALLQERCKAGRRTVVVQGPVDDSLVLLYGSVPPEFRASVLLRFPVGRGRRRFVQQECRRCGVPFSTARHLTSVEPWSYAAVRSTVESLAG